MRGSTLTKRQHLSSPIRIWKTYAFKHYPRFHVVRTSFLTICPDFRMTSGNTSSAKKTTRPAGLPELSPLRATTARGRQRRQQQSPTRGGGCGGWAWSQESQPARCLRWRPSSPHRLHMEIRVQAQAAGRGAPGPVWRPARCQSPLLGRAWPYGDRVAGGHWWQQMYLLPCSTHGYFPQLQSRKEWGAHAAMSPFSLFPPVLLILAGKPQGERRATRGGLPPRPTGSLVAAGPCLYFSRAPGACSQPAGQRSALAEPSDPLLSRRFRPAAWRRHEPHCSRPPPSPRPQRSAHGCPAHPGPAPAPPRGPLPRGPLPAPSPPRSPPMSTSKKVRGLQALLGRATGDGCDISQLPAACGSACSAAAGSGPLPAPPTGGGARAGGGASSDGGAWRNLLRLNGVAGRRCEALLSECARAGVWQGLASLSEACRQWWRPAERRVPHGGARVPQMATGKPSLCVPPLSSRQAYMT